MKAPYTACPHSRVYDFLRLAIFGILSWFTYLATTSLSLPCSERAIIVIFPEGLGVPVFPIGRSLVSMGTGVRMNITCICAIELWHLHMADVLHPGARGSYATQDPVLFGQRRSDVVL